MQRVCHYIKPCITSSPQLKLAKEFLNISGRQSTTLASGRVVLCTYPVNLNWRSKHSNISIPQKMAIFESFKKGAGRKHLALRHMSGAPWQMPRTAVPKPSQVTSKSEQEPLPVEVDRTLLDLLDQIYEADSVQGVLGIYEQWEGKFNEVHSARALWCISQIYSQDQQEQVIANNLPVKVAGKEVVQMQGFRKLCGQVLRDSAHMDNTSFISSLEALHKLHVPESSILVQTLLEQSKHRLNNFHCKDLSYFAYLLDQMSPSNPLVTALLDAIALRVSDVLGDATYVMDVAMLMKAVGRKLPTEQQKKLVNRLYAVMSVRPDKTAFDMVQSLYALVGMQGHTELCCEVAVAYLKESISNVQPNDLVGVMIALTRLYYYDEEFCDMVGHVASESSPLAVSNVHVWSTNQLAHLCRVYAKFAHLHLSLLDAIANSVIHPNQQYTLTDLVYILQPFAKLSYLPPNSEQFLDFITNACNMAALDQEDLWVWVAMATYLSLCGRYPDKVVDFVVQELGKVTLVKNKADAAMVSNLRKLRQAVSVKQLQDVSCLKELQHLVDSIPDHLGQPRVSPKLAARYRKAKGMTKETLASLVGEEGIIVENVNAGLGYIIDFQLDKGESRQAIVLRDSSCYATNMPHHALVSTKIMQQHLETSGYQVVWILVEDIIKLVSEEERKTYINNRLAT